MYSYQELLNKVETELSDLELSNNPISLYEPIEYVLSMGGKRIRPVVTLMAANLFTDNINEALSAAVGLEVFHNFTLLHDDIMDDAPMRRNKPTVHEKWSNNTAILSGDAMFILANQLVSKTKIDALKEVFDVYNQTALEVCEGQQYDMAFETQAKVMEQEYLTMIRLKTAVLLAASLKIGGLIGGASDENAQHLYDFGINLGLAFQLMDDLLDTFGDTETFGKKIGGDIRANKKTYLFIKALENADQSTAKTLQGYYCDSSSDDEDKVKNVTAIFTNLKVKEIAEEKMQLFYNEALNHLSNISIPDANKIELKSLAAKLMKRES